MCWVGAVSADGGWTSRWEPAEKGRRGCFSPVGAGRPIKGLKLGDERIRFVF